MAAPDLAVRRPVATCMALLAVALLGLVAYTRLPVNLLPDVAFPTRSVWTEYRGAGPGEVERLVTAPLEESLARVPGVREVTSRSRSGQSLVRLRFGWGEDMEVATLRVREALAETRGSLPRSAGRPTILRTDPSSDPVLTVAVSGGDPFELGDLARSVFARRLEQLEGVALAAVTGAPEREIRVSVDPVRMAVHGVGIGQVAEALDRANYSAPGGRIRHGRFHYSLRTEGQFRSLADVRSVVVAREEGPGIDAPVRLGRVADVARTTAERTSLARFDGEPAVGLEVYKEAGSNTVRVAGRVERALEQLRAGHPEVRLEMAHSQAVFVREALAGVVWTLVLGGFLAFLVLFFFLRDPRYPVAVGLSIPLSVLAALGLLEVVDVSLNVMSMGGLALGVGMLVDNSIVVLENVFRHEDEEGRSPREASVEGAGEVAPAITASTLTTIAVFGPLLYVEGVAGALFRDLSLAVTLSLLASLAVAVTLLPVLAERLARRRGARASGSRIGRAGTRLFSPGLRAFERGFRRLASVYEEALGWSLEHRGVVLGLAGLSLAAAAAVGGLLPRSLMPAVDERRLRVEARLPVGTPLETTDGVARRLEERLLGAPGVASVFTRVGRSGGDLAAGLDLTGVHQASLEVRLSELASHGRRMAAEARALLGRPDREAGRVTVAAGGASSLSRALALEDADVEVRIQGLETGRLFALADSARRRLSGVQALAGVRVDPAGARPALRIEVLRGAVARHGLTVREVADAVESYLRGERTDRAFSEFARKLAIRVSLSERGGRDLAEVLGLRVGGVPLASLVEVHRGYGPVEVRREGQRRTVRVLAGAPGGDLDAATGAARAALEGLRVPPGATVRVGGANERMRESFHSLAFAFVLALVLVYLILAAQFESVRVPLVVLAAVPLAAVGAVLALGAAGKALDVVSGIGVVVLVGVVVNDAIVKVDFVDRRRADGLPLRDALLEAGRLRFRPIVMTTVTTVLGLTPMALGWGAGADLRSPLAVAVIGGLLSSTLLTLVVVPVLYALVATGDGPVQGRPAAGRAEGRQVRG